MQSTAHLDATVCPHCQTAECRRETVHRINPLSTFVARILGIVAILGVVHGITIALSGFGGHYGAYPRGQLITHSLFVGTGVVAVNLCIGLLGWRLLGKKGVLLCPTCGHRMEE